MEGKGHCLISQFRTASPGPLKTGRPSDSQHLHLHSLASQACFRQLHALSVYNFTIRGMGSGCARSTSSTIHLACDQGNLLHLFSHLQNEGVAVGSGPGMVRGGMSLQPLLSHYLPSPSAHPRSCFCQEAFSDYSPISFSFQNLYASIPSPAEC